MPVDNERPAYVKFEVRAIEDRAESLAKGYYVAKDETFVIIQRPGDRDTVERIAAEWIVQMREKARSGAIPQGWYDAYDAAYRAYKQNEEIPLHGTPVKGWPVIGPAQTEELLRAGIRTVEDLAAMPDSDLGRISMGGISLKQKAVAFLEAGKNFGAVAEKLSAALQQVSDLAATVKAQTEEIASLRAQLPKSDKAAK